MHFFRTLLDENENKTHPDHIQVEANGFAGGGRVMSSPIHKGSRLNGVIPRMNITANPLAQDEKVSNKFHLYLSI